MAKMDYFGSYFQIEFYLAQRKTFCSTKLANWPPKILPLPLCQCSENCESSKIVESSKKCWTHTNKKLASNRALHNLWKTTPTGYIGAPMGFQHANPSHFISKYPILHSFCLIFMTLSAVLWRCFLGLIWHTYQCVLYTFVVILIPNSP